MAKKEKTIQQYRKGYKRRGIIYCVLIVLFILATVAINIGPVHYAVWKAVIPKTMVNTIEGEKKTVYSEIVRDETTESLLYYVLDENGEKQYVRKGFNTNANGDKETVAMGFEITADMRVSIIKGVIVFLLVLFIILFAIYLMRLSYYISNQDDEWKQKAGDKMTNLRIKRDKLATKLSKKKNK